MQKIPPPHQYQSDATRFMTRLLTSSKDEGVGLFADPGLGKTRMTLDTLSALTLLGETTRTLVIAPLRPCYTVWPPEIMKWGCNLSYVVLHGTPAQKRKALGLARRMHIMNPEGLLWLGKLMGSSPSAMNELPIWDTLVIDESTNFKTWSSKRMRMLRSLLKHPQLFKRRIILTGTPAPNSLADLYSQMYIVDRGAALGPNVSRFRHVYCRQGGYQGREWFFRQDREQMLHDAIAPKVYRLDEKDHLDLPKLVRNRVWVDLPNDIAKTYKQCERQLFVALEEASDGERARLVANNAGAKYAMCRGIANGGVYERNDDGELIATHHLHEAKTEAAREVVDELAGKPVLIAYLYHHDRERLLRVFPKAEVIWGNTSVRESERIIHAWNARKIRVLLVQPQCISHGVNLQAGGNDLIWYGVPDEPETYYQMNKRLHRQGVVGQVRIHHILARSTVDEAVMKRLEDKDATQRALLDYLNDYREEATNHEYCQTAN